MYLGFEKKEKTFWNTVLSVKCYRYMFLVYVYEFLYSAVKQTQVQGCDLSLYNIRQHNETQKI